MLAKGSVAPDFELTDQGGRKRTLSSLLSDGPLILYFYPADFTPGCTKEACSLRDLHQDLVRANLRVVGVSPQDTDSHRRFAEKHGLNFTLLADPDKKVIKAYDVDGPLERGP
jgi:peroxiredoxin Q/BCP